MERKFIIVVIVVMALFTLGQLPTAQENSELKKISLVYSDYAPPDTRGALFFKQQYLPRVQKELAKIGYELDIKFYHNETLSKGAEQVQACEAGLLDITLYSPDYNADLTPLHEILNMPLMGYNEYSATRIWFDLQDTIPEFGDELKNFKELFHFMAFPMTFNLNKTARVPEDFKGLKILSSGLTVHLLESIGAIPITKSPQDFYTILKNDLSDGIALGVSAIPMYNLTEVVKVHVQPTGDSLGLTGLSFIINRNKFESLPPEVRKIIDDNVLWASERMTEIEVKNVPVYEKICKKAGNTFIKLTPEEMEKWHDVVKPLHKKWIKSIEAKGLPGEKVYEEAKRLAKKYKKNK